mgnify:CR=1 FL=1
MALTDAEKDVLGWAMLVPGFLHMIGELTGEEGFSDAADKLTEVPVDKIAEVMGALRTDYAARWRSERVSTSKWWTIDVR